MQQINAGDGPASSPELAGAIDAAGWGVFFIWVGVCVLADLGWGLFFLGTGTLMLAAQAVRRGAGFSVDRFALLLGACFAVVALARLFELRWPSAAVPGWAAPVLLMAFGVALIALAWRRGRRR